MITKHPAVQAYEDLWQRIVDNITDASLMPMGSGDIVGRSRFEAEMNRLGIEYPDNIIHFFQWWEEIGGMANGKRLTRKWKRLQKEKQNQHSDWMYNGRKLNP